MIFASKHTLCWVWTWTFLLLMSHGVSGGASVLKGGDLTCTEDKNGQDIQVPGITDQKFNLDSRLSFKCKCVSGVVRCERKVNTCAQVLRGCHYVQEASGETTGCQYECRNCTDHNGITYQSGQVWASSRPKAGQCSVINKCFSGVITQAKQSCPPPMCADPVPPKEAGQCCPSCQGCSRAGQVFGEGETKQDVTDPCNKCTCKNGSLTCVRQTCPVLPCPGPSIRKRPGTCCGECVRHQLAPKIPHMCLFKGKVYRVGRTHKPNECTTCTCTKSLTMFCKKAACPTLDCPLMYQRRVPGKCCAHCSASYETSDKFLAAIRPPAQQKQPAKVTTCRHEGKTYHQGQSWPSGCQQCQCQDGRVTCSETKCSVTSCPPGSVLKHPEPGSKDCCPKCEYKEGVCTVFGDPHYKTFDGQVFNFQGSCKYLLAQDCDTNEAYKSSDNSSAFSIRITNDARASSAFSWTRTITIRLNGIKVSLLQKLKVKINGKRVPLPYIKLGSLSIMKDGYRVVVRTNEGKNFFLNTTQLTRSFERPKRKG